MSVNTEQAHPQQVTHMQNPCPSTPVKLSNKATNTYLTPTDIQELKKLNKFELFGGRIKKGAIRGLINNMGDGGIKTHWKLSDTEYNQGMESVFGENLKNMPPAVKLNVLNSRYGYDDLGIERNVSPLGNKHYLASVTTGTGSG